MLIHSISHANRIHKPYFSRNSFYGWKCPHFILLTDTGRAVEREPISTSLLGRTRTRSAGAGRRQLSRVTYFCQGRAGSSLLKCAEARGSILPSFLHPSASTRHALATLLGACYLSGKSSINVFNCGIITAGKTKLDKLDHAYTCLRKTLISYRLTET